MEKEEWYLEYEITTNRPGLLGDITSLLGMISINILTINGIDEGRRGLLILAKDAQQIKQLESILNSMETISLLKLRKPNFLDRLAVRHGRSIHRDAGDRKTFRFVREELGILVDFMAELMKQEGHKLIGIRGMPRVGKTEAIVAASVCANKRWIFVSSTLIKQTIRNQLIEDEFSDKNVYIFDGIVSTKRVNERHFQLIREIMRTPAVKVIEHPDIFVQNTEYTMDDFDYMIELRHHYSEEISYDPLNQNDMFSSDFGGFDI